MHYKYWVHFRATERRVKQVISDSRGPSECNSKAQVELIGLIMVCRRAGANYTRQETLLFTCYKYDDIDQDLWTNTD